MSDVLPVYQSDDVSLALDFGVGYDLTGTTIYLTAKRTEAAADADEIFRVSQASHTDAVNGKSTVKIPRATMQELQAGAEYFAWLQIKAASGDVSTVGDFLLHVVSAPFPP